MGRPPCCDKVGIKKGPWTPEEDIVLVSYIQQHGPGNWRAVPTNTGLLRCSKSCRLRWTNYLRPGIKRGNFTTHEEGMIIHLQSLMGNKWAAIASYLPQRTDNDIKNYWNTHLKKKIKKLQSGLDPYISTANSSSSTQNHHYHHQLINKTHIDDDEKNTSLVMNNNIHEFINQPTNSNTTTYASSTENISRLLEGWMRSSPKTSTIFDKSQEKFPQNQNGSYDFMSTTDLIECNQQGSNKVEQESCEDNDHHNNHHLISSHEDFDSLLSFEMNMSNLANWEKSSASLSDSNLNTEEKLVLISSEMSKKRSLMENQQELHQPFSLLEKWLLDEATAQVQDIIELSSIVHGHSFPANI